MSVRGLGRWWTWMSTSRRCTYTPERRKLRHCPWARNRNSAKRLHRKTRAGEARSKQGKGTCLKSSVGLPVTVAAANRSARGAAFPQCRIHSPDRHWRKRRKKKQPQRPQLSRGPLSRRTRTDPLMQIRVSQWNQVRERTELPATAIAIPETNRDVANTTGGRGEIFGGAAPFDGVYIALSDLLSLEEETAAREFITSAGGISVRETAAAAAYVVCPAAPTPEERRKLSGVSEAESARRGRATGWKCALSKVAWSLLLESLDGRILRIARCPVTLPCLPCRICASAPLCTTRT